MTLLDMLTAANTLAELEDVWGSWLTRGMSANPVVTKWAAQWQLGPQTRDLVTVASSKEPFVRRGALHGRPFYPCVLRHPTLSAYVSADGRSPVLVQRALERLNADHGVSHALAFSYHLLRANREALRASSLLSGPHAIILVDSDAEIWAVSSLAESILNSSDSPLFMADGGRLRFKSKAFGTIFRRELENVFGATPHALMHAADYAISLTRRHQPNHETIATLTLRHIAAIPHVDVQHLKEAFGLTPAQAKLALAIIRGETIDAYATRMQLSRPGIKWHLAPLMRTLGCSKREQLVAKLVRWAG